MHNKKILFFSLLSLCILLSLCLVALLSSYKKQNTLLNFCAYYCSLANTPDAGENAEAAEEKKFFSYIESDKSETRKYVNHDLGISFSYPADFNVREDYSKQTVQVSPFAADDQLIPYEQPMLSIKKISKEKYEEWIKHYEDELKNQGALPKEIASQLFRKDIRINGNPAILMRVHDGFGGGTITYVFMEINNSFFIISCGNETPFADELEEIIYTIEF